MIRRLRFKIIGIVTAACLLLLVVVLSAVFYSTRTVAMSDPIGSFEWILTDLKRGEYHGVSEDAPRPMAIFFCQPDGQIEMDARHKTADSGPELLELAERLISLEKNEGYITAASGQYYAYRRELLDDGRTILMVADVTLNNDMLMQFKRSSFVAAGTAMVVILLLSILFAGWVVRPIARAKQQQQDFFAAASHDLKTPLTVIRANIALLTPEQDESLRAVCCENIQSESEQMEHLIQDMLDHLSFEEQAKRLSPAVLTRLDMGQLVQKSLCVFEPLYFEQGLTLQSQVEEKLMVDGDRQSLERLMGILLDNALKYALPHTEVRLTLQAHGKNQLRMELSNAAAPLSREELNRIFEPFYRIDPARTDRKSYGLGLSTAKSIARLHRGDIRADSCGDRVTLSVLLPLAH